MRLRIQLFCVQFILSIVLHASDKDVGDALIKGGAQVKYEGENAVSILFSSKSKDEPRDPTPEQLVQTGTLKHLKSLTIYNNCGATDETIGFIDGLDTLESAAINALKISDAGMSHFANVKNLKKLTLWHCFNKQFNGSGSAALAALPKLESYACDGSTFNDEGLKACAALKQVSALRFHHTAATDAGFVHLKGMENLKSLTLSTQFSVRIGDGSLAAIAEIPNLEKLEINETLLTYEGGLKHLKKLPKLKELVLKETEISDDDMSKLKADLSNTQIGWTKPKPEQAEKMKADLAKKKK